MRLKNIIAALALTGAAGIMSAQTPKYIFYYIGDGMGLGPVMTAENYNRMVLGNDTPLLMLQMPVVGWSMTYSASAPITDSAAAGTALSTGFKTKNSMLGMNPDTVSVTSVARMLKDEGFGVGVVTSVAPDDATPGAFYAHVPNRKMYYEIDRQMAESGYDFIAGAGLRGLKDADGKPTDALSHFADNNVQLVYGPEEIAGISSEKVVLLNPRDTHDWNIGYTIDSISGVLDLPLIAQTCLRQLEKNSPDRFFMMVEGGNIDHALHANDGGAAVKEILNFNQALQVAFDFYKEHPDETLIIVTADHDTGGMAFVHPKLKSKAASQLGVFDWQKVSKETFNDYCKSVLKSRSIYTWDDMKQYLSDNFGLFTNIPLDEAQEAALRENFDATFERRNTADQETLYASFNAFAVDVFDLLSKAAGVAFTTTSHSSNPVPVCAIGVGADNFKGLNNNIDIPRKIRMLTEKK